MDMNLMVLRGELLSDPLSRGYAGMTDTQAADSLNAANRPVTVTSVATKDVIEAVLSSEYNALTADQKQILWGMVGAGSVDPNGTHTRAIFGALFSSGTQTRTNLLALANGTPISRATELGLPGVGPHHVALARV